MATTADLIEDDLGPDGDAWIAEAAAEIVAGLEQRLAAEAAMDEHSG